MNEPGQVVVIGGTRGLGAVLAQRFAEQGYSVTVAGRSAVTTEVPTKLQRAYRLDLQALGDLQAFANFVEAAAPLRYLVFAQRLRSEPAWDDELQVGLTATMRIVEAFTPIFHAPGDRAITLVSSVYAQYAGSSQPAAYHVAKAGCNQLMRYYAATLGARGIRANAVLPMTYLKSDAPQWKRDRADIYRAFVPLGRMATVDEVADVVEYFSSSKASYVSGQCMTVDGGTSCVWNEELALSLLEQPPQRKSNG